MARPIALPRRTPGVIEADRPDALTACFIQFPLPGPSGHLVDIELAVSKGFRIRLDDGRVLGVGPGMGVRVGGCDYTRDGFVSDVPDLVNEALFTLINPATAQLNSRLVMPGTRVLVTLRSPQPKNLISIKKIMFALETPDPNYH